MKPLRKNLLRPLRDEDYKFPRRERPELQRIPWESEGDRFPEVIEWGLIGDVIVLAACLVGVVLIFLGVIP